MYKRPRSQRAYRKNQCLIVCCRKACCLRSRTSKSLLHFSKFIVNTQLRCAPQPNAPIPGSTPSDPAPSPHALLQNYATNSPLVTLGSSSFTPKIVPCRGAISTPSTCLILGPSRPTNPNGIQNQSAVFPQYTRQADGHTDIQSLQTDRWKATSPEPIPSYALLIVATRLVTIMSPFVKCKIKSAQMRQPRVFGKGRNSN